jgi:putative oxidoreductase
MRKTVQEAGLPWPHFTTVFVAFCELLFGAMLVSGILLPLACIVLMIIMIVAIITVRMPEWKGNLGDWIRQFLYLPETLYLVILFWLLLSGPGPFSAEHALEMEYAAPQFPLPGDELINETAG